MKREENESFDKYQERRKQEQKITKMEMRGKIIGCKKCGKHNVTLRKFGGEYICESCMKGIVGK